MAIMPLITVGAHRINLFNTTKVEQTAGSVVIHFVGGDTQIITEPELIESFLNFYDNMGETIGPVGENPDTPTPVGPAERPAFDTGELNDPPEQQ